MPLSCCIKLLPANAALTLPKMQSILPKSSLRNLVPVLLSISYIKSDVQQQAAPPLSASQVSQAGWKPTIQL